MSGGLVVVAGGAWACVPGHDHGAAGSGEAASTNAGTGTPVGGAPGAGTPAAATPAANTPAMPSSAQPASSPVTGAGMWNPTPASNTASGGGSSQYLGYGLFAAGGALLAGGVVSVVRSRRPGHRPDHQPMPIPL